MRAATPHVPGVRGHCLWRGTVLFFSHSCNPRHGQGGPVPHSGPCFSRQTCGVLGPCQTMTLLPPFLCWG